jgi:ribose/xylose/arabinose/galactoside ABC-type transport system permease subunit
MPAAIGLSLLVGTTAGAINGLLIALLRVHPLIVTLATMNAFRGIALAIAGGNAIGGFPAGWRTIAGGAFLGIPGPLWFIGTLAIFER